MERDDEIDCLADDCQPYPKTGPLLLNLNLDLEKLKAKLTNERGQFHAYVVDTLDIRNGEYCQRGTGPNFQGGVLTLCTCKHKLRASPNVQKGTWMAGLSGTPLTRTFFENVQSVSESNGLFYLAKVLDYSLSQLEFWKLLGKLFPSEVRQSKASNVDTFGDVFPPIELPGANRITSPYSPESYSPPVKNHPHFEISKETGEPRWHKDINYSDPFGRRQKYLVADPTLTFIWSKPHIYRKGSIGRPGGGKGVWPGGLQQFLGELTSVRL